MKYLVLAYYDERKFNALTDAERQAIVSGCPPRDAALRDSGHLEMVASLAEPSDSVSVRPRNGKPVVTDGPYMETNEVLGSFFLIEAADMDEAVRIASLHPAANLGEQVGWGIEVRRIDFCLHTPGA
jgi:hypothetical protein